MLEISEFLCKWDFSTDVFSPVDSICVEIFFEVLSSILV
jgi:hypothetical protein